MKKKLLMIGLITAMTSVPSVSLAKMPNDPYGQQWGYKTVNLYDAWDYTTGSQNVVVAVIDNGFDRFHPDLRDNVWINSDEIEGNGVDDDNNGYIDDVYGWNFVAKDYDGNGMIDGREGFGNNDPVPDVSQVDAKLRNEESSIHHGTTIAGIIGARGDNGRDGAGINWQVKLMNLKALDEKGIGEMETIVRALYYAVDNGADIVNISLVGPESSDSLQQAIEHAYRHDVLVVAAAGNNRINLNGSRQYPICVDVGKDHQSVLGVTAIGRERYLASFSNRGSDCVNLTAPGVEVGGPLRYDPNQGFDRSYYEPGYSGTSLAAPFVSGAAALVKALQPRWGVDEITHALTSQVHKTPPDDEALYANLYGSGLLQIDKAVRFAYEQRSVIEQQVGDPAVAIAGFDITRDYFALKRLDDSERKFDIMSNWKDAKQFKLIQNFGQEQLVTLYPEGEETFTIYFHYALNPFAYKATLHANSVLDFTVRYSAQQEQYIMVALLQKNASVVVEEYDLFGTLLEQIPVTSGVFDEGKIEVFSDEVYGITVVGEKIVYGQVSPGGEAFVLQETPNIGIQSVYPVQLDGDDQKEFFGVLMTGDHGELVVIDDNGAVLQQKLVFPNVYTGTVYAKPFVGKNGILQMLVYMDSGLQEIKIYDFDLVEQESFWFFSRAKRNLQLFPLY
ncbi:S8 family serine peptidase [Candidatus Nomurabacteria bacterium]|nr:S8 family serine peptidase [Candidatus Nomurabacteria bacterium]